MKLSKETCGCSLYLAEWFSFQSILRPERSVNGKQVQEAADSQWTDFALDGNKCKDKATTENILTLSVASLGHRNAFILESTKALIYF
jgi:hypothetical protein